MMLEILIALGIFILLILVGAGGRLLHGHMLFFTGAATAAVGLVVGVIVGIRYHVALYRALEPLGKLGPRWWWNPTRYNAHVPYSNKRSVMLWFYAGVASMVVVLAGCVLILFGILIM